MHPHTLIHVSEHTQACTHIHSSTFLNIHKHAPTYTLIHVLNIDTHAPTYILMHIFTHTQACTHEHPHAPRDKEREGADRIQHSGCHEPTTIRAPDYAQVTLF